MAEQLHCTVAELEVRMSAKEMQWWYVHHKMKADEREKASRKGSIPMFEELA